MNNLSNYLLIGIIYPITVLSLTIIYRNIYFLIFGIIGFELMNYYIGEEKWKMNLTVALKKVRTRS